MPHQIRLVFWYSNSKVSRPWCKIEVEEPNNQGRFYPFPPGYDENMKPLCYVCTKVLTQAQYDAYITSHKSSHQ